jgi:Gas vesicle synthesis protein GvpL/GvpF
MLYVYGIVRAEEGQRFDVEPMPGAQSVETGPASDGLAFISSEVGDQRLRSSRANLLAHTRVLETVMKTHDVLPIRFGTLIDSNVDGARVLEANKEEFAHGFSVVEGCVEISLKVHWHHNKVFEDVMARNAGLRAERDDLSRVDPTRSHYARIEFGKKVENAIAAIRAEDSEVILRALRPSADQIIEGAALDDTMIVNLSCLVDRDRLTKFDIAVEKLDQLHSNRWTFRYVGPMPTFSFADLSINFSPETVEG